MMDPGFEIGGASNVCVSATHEKKISVPYAHFKSKTRFRHLGHKTWNHDTIITININKFLKK